ncbi:O-antigen ligase family protein [Sphingobacterium sp. DN00404]|uniref:O-antigen ligase family protein n=1 Tax=Sphingobacterium micropteri TaxID=2763501 RepID=A0ABR7YNG2_9SPHI|nr:O-antigen ligase family protein [Sphingobacterium micropteri]MBD1432870.1 O-antigen ligase family protein [Sphingobacterium micropteri]
MGFFARSFGQISASTLLLATMFSLLLIISLLACRHFPNGLFSIKEIGFYAVCGIWGGVGVWYSWRYKVNYRLRLFDGLILVFLIAVPSLQYLLHGEIHWYSVAKSLGFALIYIVVLNICSTVDCKSVILAVCLATSLLFLINLGISVIQYVGWQHAHHQLSKISGMFFNPGPYAIFLASLMMTVTVACVWTYRKRNFLLAKLLMVLLILGLLVLVELGSRSAWIGLSAGSVVLILAYAMMYCRCLTFRCTRKIIPYFFFILIIITCCAFAFYQIRPDSVKGRVLVWQSVWEMILDQPIDGIGIDRLGGEYPPYQGKILLSDNLKDRYGNLAGESIYAFNDILHTTAEKGVIGGLLFIGIIVFSIVRLYKIIRKHDNEDVFTYGTGLAASVIVIVIAGMTAYPLQMLPINIWFWTLIALANVNFDNSTQKDTSKVYGRVVTFFFLTSMTIVLLFTGVKRTIAYVRWYKMEQGEVTEKAVLAIEADLKGNGKFYNQIGHYYRVHENFDIALGYFRQAALYDFDKEYYYDLGSCYEQLEQFENAMYCYLLIEKAIPHLIKPKYLIAKLYLSQGDLQSFQSKAKEVLALTPKIRNAKHEMIKRELRFLLVNLEKYQ